MKELPKKGSLNMLLKERAYEVQSLISLGEYTTEEIRYSDLCSTEVLHKGLGKKAILMAGQMHHAEASITQKYISE